jgi:hypothetical protein
MLVNFAQSQKIEKTACERALSGWSEKCPAPDERPMPGRVGADQYRTTAMMAMTMMAAISESARSNVFERVPAEGISSGGMTWLLQLIYFRGLPRFAEINPSPSAVLRSRPAFLSASVRCAPGGISRASSRASAALAL